MNNTSLFQHQVEGVKFLEKIKKAILADEMGLGKSRQAILAAGSTAEKGIVVVCPASLKINWEREIHMVYPEDRVQIASDEPVSRETSWLILNYDTLEKHWEKLEQFESDTAILDEAHYIKNSASKRTKLALKLCKDKEQIYLLTGTPLMNRPLELFTLLQAIGHELGRNWMTFIRRYCNAFQRRNPYTGGSFWDASGASNIPELRRKIEPIMLRREKKDVLNLPEKIRSNVWLELDAEWRKKYENAWDDYLIFLEQNPPENMDNILQAKHLVELQKLKRVCSHSKIERVVEDIKNIVEEDGEKVVVFTQYSDTLEEIRKAFSRKRAYKAVVLQGETSPKERQEAVDAFQSDPDVKIFIGNTKAAGVGITLTAASKVFFVDLEWTPALHAQAEDRCHRIGQGNMVNSYYYIAKGTLEEDIVELLGLKEQVIQKILEGADTKTDSGVLEQLTRRLQEHSVIHTLG